MISITPHTITIPVTQQQSHTLSRTQTTTFIERILAKISSDDTAPQRISLTAMREQIASYTPEDWVANFRPIILPQIKEALRSLEKEVLLTFEGDRSLITPVCLHIVNDILIEKRFAELEANPNSRALSAFSTNLQCSGRFSVAIRAANLIPDARSKSEQLSWISLNFDEHRNMESAIAVAKTIPLPEIRTQTLKKILSFNQDLLTEIITKIDDPAISDPLIKDLCRFGESEPYFNIAKMIQDPEIRKQALCQLVINLVEHKTHDDYPNCTIKAITCADEMRSEPLIRDAMLEAIINIQGTDRSLMEHVNRAAWIAEQMAEDSPVKAQVLSRIEANRLIIIENERRLGEENLAIENDPLLQMAMNMQFEFPPPS
ncbi:MAG: hypothetical protein KBC64_06595 [Simkaniaceae bacterium]|nr:hypothetical protein [Simkaniaceae bacterium]